MRPGVHTMISLPRLRLLICSVIDVPPYTAVIRMPRILQNLDASV